MLLLISISWSVVQLHIKLFHTGDDDKAQVEHKLAWKYIV